MTETRTESEPTPSPAEPPTPALPPDPEFRACMQAYMRWAVDDVLSYSPVDAVVPGDAAMPRWGWDGLRT